MLTCMPLYDTFSLMRLSQYAIKMNVSYKTAFRWWKAGRLDAYQLDTGTIIVRDPLPETTTPKGIALYARVSTRGQKADLDRQVERRKHVCSKSGLSSDHDGTRD